MIVSCPCCLHEERWHGAERTVTVEGGRRRPEGHPQLVAWNTLKEHLGRADRPAVGPCPACGQPLIAEGPLAPVPWTLTVPGGALVVTDRVTADGAEVAVEVVDQRVQAAFGERLEAGSTAVKGAMILPMFAPILLWPVMIFVALWILVNAMRAGMAGISP